MRSARSARRPRRRWVNHLYNEGLLPELPLGTPFNAGTKFYDTWATSSTATGRTRSSPPPITGRPAQHATEQPGLSWWFNTGGLGAADQPGPAASCSTAPCLRPRSRAPSTFPPWCARRRDGVVHHRANAPAPCAAARSRCDERAGPAADLGRPRRLRRRAAQRRPAPRRLVGGGDRRAGGRRRPPLRHERLCAHQRAAAGDLPSRRRPAPGEHGALGSPRGLRSGAQVRGALRRRPHDARARRAALGGSERGSGGARGVFQALVASFHVDAPGSRRRRCRRRRRRRRRPRRARRRRRPIAIRWAWSGPSAGRRNATCTAPAPVCTQQCVPRCEAPPRRRTRAATQCVAAEAHGGRCTRRRRPTTTLASPTARSPVQRDTRLPQARARCGRGPGTRCSRCRPTCRIAAPTARLATRHRRRPRRRRRNRV